MKSTLLLHRERFVRPAVCLIGALTLGACASMPPPTARLRAANQAIANAQQAEAGRYAPEELGAARAKLHSAEAAASEHKMTKAARLAKESRVEAELASSDSAEVQAQAINDEMRHSTRILIQEMQRSSGDQQ